MKNRHIWVLRKACREGDKVWPEQNDHEILASFDL